MVIRLVRKKFTQQKNTYIEQLCGKRQSSSPDGEAMTTLFRRQRVALRENGKLILCLSDLDLLKMADIKAQGEKEPADFLSEMLDRLLIHLEK